MKLISAFSHDATNVYVEKLIASTQTASYNLFMFTGIFHHLGGSSRKRVFLIRLAFEYGRKQYQLKPPEICQVGL